ncbi:unnamed protein product [Albugo candida]|uniref:Uncharacterized protein n=1 Tax=Albugo candida TaxID=65357 RepID=A0A024GTZ1_9STRA|nr:unnamed protein product [Albugo candida]|eukprot:CCI50038.1 unnamed protein product [Albugo candida]
MIEHEWLQFDQSSNEMRKYANLLNGNVMITKALLNSQDARLHSVKDYECVAECFLKIFRFIGNHFNKIEQSLIGALDVRAEKEIHQSNTVTRNILCYRSFIAIECGCMILVMIQQSLNMASQETKRCMQLNSLAIIYSCRRMCSICYRTVKFVEKEADLETFRQCISHLEFYSPLHPRTVF